MYNDNNIKQRRNEMAHRAWVCEGCNSHTMLKPWLCPACGEEVCDECFDRYTVCVTCGRGKTDEQIKEIVKWSDE